jgi:hypothetical protein
VVGGDVMWYVGCIIDYCLSTYRYEAFTANSTPREEDYRYNYVIGPFRTKLAAMWAVDYGVRNPHFGCVEDAERISHQMEA